MVKGQSLVEHAYPHRAAVIVTINAVHASAHIQFTQIRIERIHPANHKRMPVNDIDSLS